MDRLRAGAPEAFLVPFPSLEEGTSVDAMYAYWRPSMEVITRLEEGMCVDAMYEYLFK